MKRITTAIAVSVVSVFLLAGCATNDVNWAGSSGPDPIDLNDSAAVVALCDTNADEVLDYVTTASESKEDSGRRLALTDWGLTAEEANDDAVVHEIIGALEVRAADESCEDEQVSSETGTVGIQDNNDGEFNLPLITGTDTTLIVDTTTQTATPPVLDGSLRFTAQTLTWEGMMERIAAEPAYIEGLNARASQTGFTWEDVQKFAAVNRMEDGKVDNSGVNALAIQIFNRPDLTDEQAQDMVRTYITPDVEKVIGMTVEELPIQRINNGFINTMNVGDKENLKMGDYFDTQHMVRVSLMPIKFDENGKAVSLDGSRGAGIFIDCGNLHWVPKAVWYCKDSSCDKPKPPPPPVMCPWNPSLPLGSNDCFPPPPPSDAKDWSKTPVEDGWVPLQAGPLTDGKESQRQQESGDTSGNVIDNPVPEGTESGDTTPDLPPGTVTAPEANEGGDDQSQGEVDEENTNQDPGGTNGDTCVPDPIVGITC